MKVKIKSAQKLSSDQKKKITDAFKKKYKESHEFKELVDEKLIGGIKLEFDQEEIDLSYENKLAHIRENLRDIYDK